MAASRKQEVQLMMTNPRDAFRGKSRSPNMVPFDNVRYGFLLLFYSNFVAKTHRFFQIVDFKKCRDLETRVRGHSGSSQYLLSLLSYEAVYQHSFD